MRDENTKDPHKDATGMEKPSIDRKAALNSYRDENSRADRKGSIKQRIENIKRLAESGEYWSSRELMEVFGYSRWQDFLRVVEKAKKSCRLSGKNIESNFHSTNFSREEGQLWATKAKDVLLSRYGCYLVAQNGDSRKKPIAEAQTYFVSQARKMEKLKETRQDMLRITERDELRKAERKLSGVVYQKGIAGDAFARLKSKGDEGLFKHSTAEMKRKWKIPAKRPLADYLDATTLAGKNFAAHLTASSVRKEGIRGEEKIIHRHKKNNSEVRAMLLKQGLRPEANRPAEDIRVVKKRLKHKRLQEKNKLFAVNKRDCKQMLKEAACVEKTLWKIALLIMTQKPKRMVTTTELIQEIPRYYDIPEQNRVISEKKEEPKWHQQVRNLKSNKKNASSFINKGFALMVEKGFQLTASGERLVRREFAGCIEDRSLGKSRSLEKVSL